MQMKNFFETENIEFLAGFDFLDLCLLGETGTGKTHTAERIHRLSPRAAGPFVAVNCAELSPTIIEAELFGAEKGSFTGAVATRVGRFESAAGGTLFLDEIGEFSSDLQAKLLKAVEEKRITRVGAHRARAVNVRIIYATNRDPRAFREDFRYRVTAHSITLPPLRERRSEIASLARHFIAEFAEKSGRKFAVEANALRLLESAEWPGNVRELKSVVEKACLGAALRAAIGKDKTAITAELVSETLASRRECRIHGHSALGFPNRYGGQEHSAAASPNSHPAVAGFSSSETWFYRHAGEILSSGTEIGGGELPDFSNAPFSLEEYLHEIERRIVLQTLRANRNNQSQTARHLGLSRTGLIKKLKRIAM